MTINTTEANFEDHIEEILLNSGYAKRNNDNFNKEYAIDSDYFFQFLQESQPQKWQQLEEIYDSGMQEEILRALDKTLEDTSLIHVIRNGFDVSDVHLECYFNKPPSANNPDLEREFNFNRLSLIRQLQYKLGSTKAVDLGFFLNGLPVATAELKHYAGGHLDAIHDYKEKRDPTEKIFKFKRGALVHFAIDTEEIHMTTKLAGNQTTFLPFNKGKPDKYGRIGKGNPYNPNGYDSSYLWEIILQKEKWLDIIENFVDIQKIPVKNSEPKEVLIFPRYHQLDVVNYLLEQTKHTKTGHSFLIEHSTGSGKSNSIAWLAYKLYSLHDDNDRPVFDSIIVLSDRIGIVDQLAKTIEHFEKKSGTTKEMETTAELVENLENYRRILITTQQKFPPALKKIEENEGKIKGKKFAILIDEAHSSQTGEDAKKVKDLLTKNLDEAEKLDSQEEEKEKDLVDNLEEHVTKHGRISTLNYYAFTATPKWNTLKLFGKPLLDENGKAVVDEKTGKQKYVAHHKYTMNQAIDEGFILDVLNDYTTYEQIFNLFQMSKDKIVETKKAIISLLKFVNSHEKSIREKSEVIVDDFEEKVKNQINGKAKAMVVTSSRLHAVRFKQAIDDVIKERGYKGIKTLVAFSGTVKQNGDSYTQSNMTKMTETQLIDNFDSDDYNILIVAEKYQTGFDQPLLHTMYVDKHLKGIKAVQTLSRLNRAHKDKNSTRVLDFRNDPKQIQKAYERFYHGASLIDNLKPGFLEELYQNIMGAEVFTEEDIEQFWSIFSKTPAEQLKSDAPALDGVISAPKSSYDALDEKKQDKFRLNIRKYHQVYSFMTNLFSFDNQKYEKLFAIIKYCLKTRKFPLVSLITDLQNDVTLASYKLKVSSSGSISLGAPQSTYGISASSSTREPEVLSSLSDIVKRLNEKFGKGDATPADILAFTELVDFLNKNEKLRDIAKVNPLPDFLRYLKTNFNEYLLNSEISQTNETLVVSLLEKSDYREEAIEFIGKIFHSGAKESIIPPISSDNPAENKLRFRQAIASCEGFIKWEDRFLDAEGLEYLEHINKEKVKRIQLLTSVYHWGVNDKLLSTFKELKEKMEKLGILCEMQVIMTKELHRKMHDRYILSENLKYNVPSPTQIKFGQYSEIKLTSADVPFDEWWNDPQSIDLIQNWDAIKAKRDELGRR